MEAFEDAAEEVVDQASAFGFGERGQLVHEFQLLGGGFAFGGGCQNHPSQSQDADLRVRCGRVFSGDFAECEFLVHDVPDRGEAESQFSQCSHEGKASDGVLGVEPVAGVGAAGELDDAPIGVEPDGLDRQPGALASSPIE